ncbi:orotate phosphoribosyltransferase [Exiguobacterium antarcticum]|uniref:Orotate phosphoribosyltransferase n=1 Tax=Exiguobacterium antarcticum TaxID=132920 RepID=A0ABT6R0K1_9BACL|nr:orotate phosphoribosyltransferase [Exiguobacterium antarcticum]AFS70898.1 Orotate phosphoribosyltransferase [Exiguobacterium antarcticum B7]MDI3233789.1 orotate phosphoribosyltransferase [Exiguobacterium antarcticum]
MNQLAKALLDIEAVTLAPNTPYTWASGLRSPIYCDNRLTLSSPDVRTLIADLLAERIKPLRVDVIAGTATAGIPHAALVAERLGLPMIYVRGSAKAHGKGNQIEGRIEAGQRVVVIEDLLSTGMSSIEATQAVKAAGATVVRIQAIFSYGMTRLMKNLEDAQVNADALLTFSELLETAVETSYISREEQERLQDWAIDPVKWSEAFMVAAKQN